MSKNNAIAAKTTQYFNLNITEKVAARIIIRNQNHSLTMLIWKSPKKQHNIIDYIICSFSIQTPNQV